MASTGAVERGTTWLDRVYLLVLMGVPLVISIAAGWVFNRGSAQVSLLTLTNLVGPTTESLLHGGGLTACTEAMGTPGNPICFHAGRMPLPSMVVAAGVEALGDHFPRVAFFKLLVFLIPLEVAIYLVWRRLPRSGIRRILTGFLLLAPFGMTPLIADVVNLQVEEAYCYSFLALAVAILFGGGLKAEKEGGLGWAILFAVSVDSVYLAKSSMVVAAFVLTVAYIFRERKTRLRWLVAVMVAIAPLGWAVHQHHASGRYSVGTSIDGINLHKGNNAEFLARYPPPAGDSLDRYDSELNVGQSFPDEWSFNDYHLREAVKYLSAHPAETLRGDVRKLDVIFVSTRKLGSTESQGTMLKVERAGLLLFRLFLWIAIGGSVYGILRRRSRWAYPGTVFLCLVAACTAPYILGFAYTRHVSILIYPAVLMCCVMLVDEVESGQTPNGESGL